MDAITSPPAPVNEPVKTYVPGTPERSALTAALDELSGDRLELTMAIDGRHRMAGGDRLTVPYSNGWAASQCRLRNLRS